MIWNIMSAPSLLWNSLKQWLERLEEREVRGVESCDVRLRLVWR